MKKILSIFLLFCLSLFCAGQNKKDAHKNPKKLLLLKNNIPFQIHLIDIEYYK